MPDKPAPDQLVASVARRQHGAISIRQLHEAGLSNDAVLERRRAGRLHRLHRGVYAVGHVAPSNSGRGGRARRHGICIHRPLSLGTSEITYRRGIPVTSPARTLADLRSCSSGRELRRALRQADVLSLEAGVEVVSDRTRSELERRFLWLCGRNRLPKPAVNMRIGAMTVDFCWVEQRLIVETDGYKYHRGREAFEDDRNRKGSSKLFGASSPPVPGRLNRAIPE